MITYKARLPLPRDAFDPESGELWDVDALRGLATPPTGNVDPQSDNNNRAVRAAAVVVAYSDSVGDQDEEISIQIADLLCDLRHFCDAVGVDFGEACDTSRMHYTAEIQGIL